MQSLYRLLTIDYLLRIARPIPSRYLPFYLRNRIFCQKAYALRMVYIGEHTLQKDDLICQFRKTVHDVNSGYCEINIQGLLLVYDSYFVHILEVRK